MLTTAPASAIHISDLNLDSLWSIWHDKTQADTNRFNAIHELTMVMQHVDEDSLLSLGQLQYDLAKEKDLAKYMANGLNVQANYFAKKQDLPNIFKFARKSLQISEELAYKKGIITAISFIGIAYMYQGENDKALDHFSQSLKLAEELGDKERIAIAKNSIGGGFLRQGDYNRAKLYFSQFSEMSKDLMNSAKTETRKFIYKNLMAMGFMNIAVVSMYQGDYFTSLDYMSRGLEVYEEAENKKRAAVARLNIGIIYIHQKNNPRAIEYLIPALELFLENDNKAEAGVVYVNLGELYVEQGDYAESMNYFERGLKIAEEMSDRQVMAYILANMGNVFQLMGNYSQAHAYIERGLAISEAIGDKMALATVLIAKAKVYQNQGKYSKAIVNASKGLQLTQQVGAVLGSRDAAKVLYNAHKAMGHQQKTLESYELYIKMRDSLINEETTRKFVEQEYRSEYEKKAVADSIKNAETAKVKDAQLQAQEAQLNEEATLRISLLGGLGLVLVFAFIIFNRLQVTRRQKKIIEDQKQQVEEQKKDITDSIRYAENIQKSLLPSAKELSLIPDGFVLFQPKDIVSGDFYWMQHHNDRIYLAACDCTGHGVPGAFMSMIGSALLDEAVVEKGITQPNEIFYEVRKGFINALKQTGETGQQKDGMDAVLIAWDKKYRLQLAAAYSPVLIISNGEVKELKPDRQPVGFYTGEQKPFTHHELKLEKGDTVYLFSDGYPDQFGGPKDKKFMMKNFKKLLLSIQDKSMNDQKTILESTMAEWQSDTEQVDDILVMGVRF